MRYTIDQLEEELAVCEDDHGNKVNIAKSDIPEEAKIGDVMMLKDGKYILDKKTANQRRKEIEEIMEDVWEDE